METVCSSYLPSSKPTQHRFQPYANNGGTVLGVAGKDFCIVAADTRMSSGYNILTRDSSKLLETTDKCVLASAGMQADRTTLHKVLRWRLQKYEQQHGKTLSTQGFAQMLANMLYGRRFFPYYTFNIVGGLDEEGVGAVYGYDAIGSYERYKFGCAGSGNALIQPMLDNQVGFNNQPASVAHDLSVDEALQLVRDVFSSAAERDIYTGDTLQVKVITKDGIREERYQLRKD